MRYRAEMPITSSMEQAGIKALLASDDDPDDVTVRRIFAAMMAQSRTVISRSRSNRRPSADCRRSLEKTRQMITFNKWIKNLARITNDPAGDFIADARRDRTLPEITTRERLKSHLALRGACSEALIASRVAWNRYIHYVEHYARKQSLD